MPGLCTRPSIRMDSVERKPRMLMSSKPRRPKFTGLTPGTVCSACCRLVIWRESITSRVTTLIERGVSSKRIAALPAVMPCVGAKPVSRWTLP